MNKSLPRVYALLLSVLVALGCSADGGRRVGGGDTGPPPADAGMDTTPPPPPDASTDTTRPPTDVPIVDPFDPDAACGSAAIPTERIPGSLLLVFDQSGSMDDPPGDPDGSGPTKWDLASDAINSVLTSTSDELSMGMLLFPSSGDCGIPGTPQVPIGPLSTTRAAIMSQLTGTPSGGGTPIFDALRAGWDYLDTLDSPGQRGLVLVTDGAENCASSDEDAVLAQAQTENTTNHYLTFVVGLDQSNSVLSTLAYNGGTPRNDTCMPECTSPLCMSASDCPSSSPCFNPAAGLGLPVPGTCGCTTDADCPTGQTCEPPLIPLFGLPPMCEGPSNCCHYDATASGFRTDFESALEEIASRFLDSCVFTVPRDGSDFDPSLVNVGVTFTGEDRQVLPRSSDETTDSWNYTTPDNDALIIQGPICDRLLDGGATVEIVVGCPTILI